MASQQVRANTMMPHAGKPLAVFPAAAIATAPP